MVEMANAPVADIDAEDRAEDGIGIALSGGGYRAMLFHLGSMLRLFETGTLETAARVSSVSGGSITSAKVALELPKLKSREDFLDRVAKPIRKLASTTVDATSIAAGVLLPGSVSDRVAAAYDKILFHGATLQQLPDKQRFVINATNVETGTLFRFSKKSARDWKVGEISNPDFDLASIIAASSAFPPVLSPFMLDVDADDFTTIEQGVDRQLLRDIMLTDGGVYDNLGLETVFKRYKTLLVSDAGGALGMDPSPPADWARHAKRVLDIIHGQVSSVRVRQLIAAYRSGMRHGAYWGIRTNIADYKLPDALKAPYDRTMELALTPTRLKRLPDPLQERLVNWGYAAADAGLRGRWRKDLGPAPVLPYPGSQI
jgi:NTE family protein